MRFHVPDRLGLDIQSLDWNPQTGELPCASADDEILVPWLHAMNQ